MDKTDFQIDSFQAILFDFDGVLAESVNIKTEAFAKLFESYGEEIVKKIVKHHRENGGISRYKKIKYYYTEYLNMPLSEDELNDKAKQFSDLVVEKVIKAPWIKGAKNFLEQHHKTTDLFVVSGTPIEEIKLIVKKREMKKYFKDIYGTPDTKPVIARLIISKNGYNPQKVLYIGDSLSDYNDAKKANIKFLGVVQKGTKSMFPNDTPVISDFLEII